MPNRSRLKASCALVGMAALLGTVAAVSSASARQSRAVVLRPGQVVLIKGTDWICGSEKADPGQVITVSCTGSHLDVVSPEFLIQSDHAAVVVVLSGRSAKITRSGSPSRYSYFFRRYHGS